MGEAAVGNERGRSQTTHGRRARSRRVAPAIVSLHWPLALLMALSRVPPHWHYAPIIRAKRRALIAVAAL
jgi:hypothetical protein